MPTKSSAHARGASPLLDLERFLRNFAGVPELLPSIVEDFLNYAPTLINEVSVAVESRDAVAVERSAHKLAGAVSNFYSVSVEGLARDLERQGQTQKLEGSEAALTKLKAEFSQLCKELVRIRDSKELGSL